MEWKSTKKIKQVITSPEVLHIKKENNTAILFNPRTGQIKLINSTATFIWELCRKGLSIDEMIEKTLTVYHGNKKEIKSDIIHFLMELERIKFVELK